ncbi:hypothetical protein CVD25_22250 [Bacillus canaveralius]|uniref:Uncharacterized protein n=1 Tax=Bacillus canaveralius TaxID=1403243 RepID=A0A2N5GFM2_9BACI|nr:MULTISPECIES: hypothetical protein [Bacillus]PLR79500.1 hypothetical protein CU635_22955 [Bacillus canaveralius]PLR83190.1 hypothetical protein CVD23_15160 [Bacillus sp. V33-4]PLR88602.1 hypothetical protein CVD25_22250 [Bacillus canaveralius]RSK47225.1 hypothetical protein EJA13_18580 [Bacillus canaveralius]
MWYDGYDKFSKKHKCHPKKQHEDKYYDSNGDYDQEHDWYCKPKKKKPREKKFLKCFLVD